MLSVVLFSLLITVPLFSNRLSPNLVNRITCIALIYASVLSCNVFFGQDASSISSGTLEQGVGVFGENLFYVSSISVTMEAFILFIGALILLGWASTDSEEVKSHNQSAIVNKAKEGVPTISEHSLMVLFTTLGACMLVSSSDLISMYLSIELQSFGLYIMAALYRNSESATAAGLKYFLLGGLSSALILLGSAIIYSYTGITQFQGIYSLVSVASSTSDYVFIQPIVFGMLLIASGFLFKVAAAPFHNWAPDVYDGTPTIITTWLSTMPKISIFVFLLELQNGLQGNLESLSLQLGDESISIWKNLLLFASLLSLVLGTVLGLSQYRIKRLLTYSTISHVGFLLLALGVNTQESVESFLFYILQYSITNINVFLVLLAFGYMLQNTMSNKFGSDIQFIEQLKGQFHVHPVLSLSFALCLFSMAGIPPLIGFFAKQMVLYSSTHGGYYFLSIVAIVVSVISASYYLKIIQVIYFSNTDNQNLKFHSHNNDKLAVTNMHSMLIAILSAILVLFVLQPSILLNSCQLLSLSLFTY